MDTLIILIDFEKAFDSISWSFIDKTLQKFNFGTDFRKWVKIIYHNSESTVLKNGFFTSFFKLERGVRQGCPLSAYLFLLVVELLACEIRDNAAIEGLTLKHTELKISQMADDTTIFLINTESIPILLPKTMLHYMIRAFLRMPSVMSHLFTVRKPNRITRISTETSSVDNWMSGKSYASGNNSDDGNIQVISSVFEKG